jgi:peptide-methionine (S)-S-oxide reductase
MKAFYLVSIVLAILFVVFNVSAEEKKMVDVKKETAIFAGGCFWCTEADFEKLSGVISVVSGYAGGGTKNPSYEQVSDGGTGHAEAVLIEYDPKQVSYRELLDYYWKHIDPTVKDRQFCDVGSQYRSAIFFQTEEEEKLALETKAEIEKSKNFKVHTEIVKFKEFFQAEEYHQGFYKKNPLRYESYRNGCGRDQRLKELWG